MKCLVLVVDFLRLFVEFRQQGKAFLHRAVVLNSGFMLGWSAETVKGLKSKNESNITLFIQEIIHRRIGNKGWTAEI